MPGVGGDIELMSLSDIAMWLAGRKLSGTLSARRRGVEVRFTLRQGLCAQASSTDPREYLGQHLINFGHINEEQLQQAFDTQKETKVPLGRVLVMVDLLTQAQLQTVIYFKTREGLLEALGWRDGTWRFVPESEADPELDSDRPVDLREAISEASAREAMWGEIRRVFPSDGTRCDVLVDPVGIDSVFDRKLLTHMATGASVGEAALELRAMDFQVYARLYDLANRQLVRPVLTSTVRLARTATPMALPSPLTAPAAPAATSPAAAAAPAATTAATTAPGLKAPRAKTPTPAPTPALGPFPSPASLISPLTAPRSKTPGISAPPPPPPVVAPLPPTPALFPLPQAPAAPAAPAGGPAFSSGFALGRVALQQTLAPTPAPPAAALPPTKTPPPLVPIPGWSPSSAAVVHTLTTQTTTMGDATPVPARGSAVSVHELELRVDVEEGAAPGWSPPSATTTTATTTTANDEDGYGTYMMVKRPSPVESPIQALEVALAGRNWSEAVLLAQRILEHDPHDSEAIAALRVADTQLRKLEKQGGLSDADLARVPRLLQPIGEIPVGHLTSKERYVLSRIDGVRSLTQIAAVSPVQRAELSRIVENFVQRGVVGWV